MRRLYTLTDEHNIPPKRGRSRGQGFWECHTEKLLPLSVGNFARTQCHDGGTAAAREGQRPPKPDSNQLSTVTIEDTIRERERAEPSYIFVCFSNKQKVIQGLSPVG